MTIKPVSYSQIECDSCGKIRLSPEPDGVSARIAASKDGWRYVAWNIRGLGLQKRIPDRHGRRAEDAYSVKTVPKQWDCCPDCEVPAGPAEAAEIRSKRDSEGRSDAVV